MEIIHNSQDEFYRFPFGACTCGQKLTLRIKIDGIDDLKSVYLRLWQDGVGEILLPMTAESAGIYKAEYEAPEKPMLLWYYFILEKQDRRVYYGSAGGGGIGVYQENDPPQSYQITVYRGYKTPAWFKKAVMYQIFPDRFYRSEKRELNCREGGLFHPNWHDTPAYLRDPETKDVLAYDFFGGNLFGIEEKLDYLKELGITVLYLNPIFMSSSNHRYDIIDYEKIDPMLGNNEDFIHLCQEAKKKGIEIILDGVFSHNAHDSIYFLSACESKDSPYYEWYRFSDYPHDYESWWGIKTMPNVEEMTESYRDFIVNGDNSVVKQWLKRGAKGWRLDVADELPDQFIKEIRTAMKKQDPESVLIGEVWEDASNKRSYDVLREYFLGQELDTVMNYPARKIVIDFILGKTTACAVLKDFMSLYENYPKESFYALMNLLGSHDRERILTILGEAGEMSDLAKFSYRLPEDKLELAKKRLKMLVAWQMTFPGVPSIYYGDEVGLEGFSDPYNRGTYPWGKEDVELLEYHKKLIALRHKNDMLSTGKWKGFAIDEDVFGYLRWIDERQDVFNNPAENGSGVVVFNRSDKTKKAKITVRGLFYGILVDALDGDEVQVKDGEIEIEIPPMSAMILLQKVEDGFHYKAGALMHITSLPSEYGLGDLGGSYDFIDFLESSGLKYWQILPTNPAGLGESPYQSYSAFAGHELLIDLDDLFERNLLTKADLKDKPDFPKYRVDFPLVREWKEKLLKKAYAAFTMVPESKEYLQFVKDTKWLADYALFMSLYDHFEGKEWTEWPEDIARRDKAAMDKWSEKLSDRIHYYYFVQYIFFSQWQKMKKYAGEKGISIIGDIPIFVAHNSTDVWSNPKWFDLNPDGSLHTVAGVPPDYFSETGQRWGNPLYKWDEMKKTGYSWWQERLEWLFKQADVVRIDHFRGFAAFWQIDADEPTAINGQWIKGPSSDFFKKMQEVLGRDTQIIVEDLGILTDDVIDLRDEFAYPGVNVLQFKLLEKYNGYRCNSVLYSGTHDNDTLVGWYDDLSEEEKKIVWEECGIAEEGEAIFKLWQKTLGSNAGLVIMPIQDFLQLDTRARMNLPGTVGGNWSWMCQKSELNDKLSKLIKKHLVLNKRL